MRVWSVAVVVTGLAVHAAGACPNPDLRGSGSTVTGPDILASVSLRGPVGGPATAEACGLVDLDPAFRSVTFSSAPTATVALTGMDTVADLTIAVDAACATTLMVHAPDETWHVDWNLATGLPPVVTLTGSEIAAGPLDIWIGARDGADCAARIVLSGAR